MTHRVRHAVMKNEAIWINQGTRCNICGKAIRNGEDYCLIIGNGLKRAPGNFVAHSNEFLELAEKEFDGALTEEQFIACLNKINTLKVKKEKIKANTEHVEIFKQTIKSLGAKIKEENSCTIYFELIYKFKFIKNTETLKDNRARKNHARTIGDMIEEIDITKIAEKIIDEYKTNLGNAGE